MAIKNIIAKGIGFSPGSVKFIPTHGFIAGAAFGALYTNTPGARVSSETVAARTTQDEVTK